MATGYNPNVDYSEQMKKYLEQGGSNSLTDLEFKSLYDARNNKISNMSPSEAQKQGVAGEYTQITGYQYPTLTGVGDIGQTPRALTQADLDAAIAKNNTAWQAQLDAQAAKQNPYDQMMADYKAQAEALAMETDPDYDENLVQLSPEELKEEIL